uniref:Co-chaperonin GroES n=1 Tax=uncultured virus TaxID=340016 RepID=A0A221S380_9VIRU|nr:co-chaperonin GroES [uncultured virus]
MRPIGDYIVVDNIKQEILSKSGLTLSGEEADLLRYKMAKVVQVGDEVSQVSVDDVIYYDKSNSFSLVIEDGTYTVIRLRSVVLVV